MVKKIDPDSHGKNSITRTTNTKMVKGKTSAGSKTTRKIPAGSKTRRKTTSTKTTKATVKQTIKTSTSSKSEPTLVQRKRGRRYNKLIKDEETVSNQSLSSEPKNDSAVIVKMRFDPSKHFNMNKSKTSVDIDSDSEDSSYNEMDKLSDGMFCDDIPRDNLCKKCSHNEDLVARYKARLAKYEKKDKIEKTNKVHINKLNLINLSSGKKVSIKKTRIRCWHDTHTFDSTPCFLVEAYHNDIFYVVGCFCNLKCALAYNLYTLADSKMHIRKSLTIMMHKMMYKIPADEPIDSKEAPPREILVDYGGNKTIDEFRRLCMMPDKEFKLFVPPIRPINLIIEEKDISLDDPNTDNDLVLKRSRPIEKKNTILASMNIKMVHH